jgi:hypothetical protein
VVGRRPEGAAAVLTARAGQYGWTAAPTRRRRPPGRLSHTTVAVFTNPAGATVTLEYKRDGDLYGQQTLTTPDRQVFALRDSVDVGLLLQTGLLPPGSVYVRTLED